MAPPEPSAERATEPESTRFAAALRYREGMAAPLVTAKGRGLVADEIIRRAVDHGVAIHVSNNLAALLMQVDIDRAIPPQLFHAVAELLAWLYRLEAHAAKAGIAACASGESHAAREASQ